MDLAAHDYSPDYFCDFSDSRATVHILERINSQDPASVGIIQSYLQGRPVDFLYIDADHSYEGVKADYEIWTPLVRPGGLVGFHDTNHPPVRQLLQEKNHPRLVCVDHGFGTGLIQGW